MFVEVLEEREGEVIGTSDSATISDKASDLPLITELLGMK